MGTHNNELTGKRSLNVLGITEAEEAAYRWLLANSAATVAELAQALSISPGKTQRLLDSIEAKGLTTQSPERPRRYIPVSPNIALKALSLQCQEELHRADAVIQGLQEQLSNQREGKQEQIVELVTSREAMRLAHRQMIQSARREVVALSRPPMLITQFSMPSEQEQSWQREAQKKGVRFRTIVDSALLSLPNAMQFVQADIDAGEETRLIPSLPIKLVLVDQNIALIPLNLEQPDSASLLIRSSALLNLFYEHFEDLWSRAAPLSFSVLGQVEIGEADTGEHQKFDDLLKLMAAGANDKTIIRELGISEATLTRSVRKLKQSFDARTRFQLGWIVNQHINQR